MKMELLRSLTEEQIAKVKAFKNQEEMLALAKAEGAELAEEQLEAVSGGGCLMYFKCPNATATQPTIPKAAAIITCLHLLP